GGVGWSGRVKEVWGGALEKRRGRGGGASRKVPGPVRRGQPPVRGEVAIPGSGRQPRPPSISPPSCVRCRHGDARALPHAKVPESCLSVAGGASRLTPGRGRSFP